MSVSDSLLVSMELHTFVQAFRLLAISYQRAAPVSNCVDGMSYGGRKQGAFLALKMHS
jgi:hypothetical protein